VRRYPNHTEGASCLVYPGSVTGNRVLEGQRYFSVSQPIVRAIAVVLLQTNSAKLWVLQLGVWMPEM